MSWQQFKRLYLVVFFPLLAFGFWLARSELLIPHSPLITCWFPPTFIGCSGEMVTTEKASHPDIKSHSIREYYLNNLVFAGGIYEDIQQVDMLTGRPIWPEQHLSSSTLEGCFISRFDTPKGGESWQLRCSGPRGSTEMTFKFVDETVHRSYAEVYRNAIYLNEEFKQKSKLYYGISVVLPLLAFGALSAFCSLVAWAYRFVRYGGRKSSINEQSSG